MNRLTKKLAVRTLVTTALVLQGLAHLSLAANQTATVTPLSPASGLPYRVELRPYDFGSATLPTLHSYAAAEYDGKWVLMAGRTNGLHDFSSNPTNNFPAEFQNRDVWVIDPVSKESWRRSLDDASSGLTEDEILSLTPTNNQFYQKGDRLYMTGGYGVKSGGGFGTFDSLSAIDLPGMIDWVVNGTDSAASNIRQIQSDSFRVTGGDMYEIDGRTHVVFGQDFQGGYNPGKNGTYTKQVRSFDIVDDGTQLSISNEVSTVPEDEYRRRDLNIVPVLRPDGNSGLKEELVVLSGVFTESFGAWTVPVEIDSTGQTSMADPTLPETFKQGFNGYHSAKLGFYSEADDSMHQLMFGGISLQYLDESTGQVETDEALPFVNDITSISIDSSGIYSQFHLGHFPELFDQENKRLRFGANAEFFLADGIPTFGNGVIKYDELSGETSLGLIFGGIVTNGPHTRQGANSSGSNMLFEVVLTQVPEPVSATLVFLAAAIGEIFSIARRQNTSRSRRGMYADKESGSGNNC